VQWLAGVRSGQGVLRVPDGYVYSGEWAHDRKHGHGMATYKDGAPPSPGPPRRAIAPDPPKP
jgi:hypothetical protein